MKIKVAIVQMEIFDGEKEKNLYNALIILKSIVKLNELPDIVCFPELFTTGYDLQNVGNYAELLPGNTTQKIATISRNKCIVIGSILERIENEFYNTAFVINKKGEISGKYRKIHLFSPMLEKEYLTPGDKIQVFNMPELNNLTIGVAICYDIRFPELFRTMALMGAQIIFIPSEFPDPKKKIWKSLLYARAIENQLYIIAINRVGKGKHNSFFGYSLISNGDYLEHLEDLPETKIFLIDTDTLVQIRESLPVFKDRRPELYKI